MTNRPIVVFVSYSEKDAEYFARFNDHLSGLRRDGTVEIWHEARLMAGDNLAVQVDTHLDKADIIILAISAEFLASDYIHDAQITRALARHKVRSSRVIPLILRAVEWKSTALGSLQPLPRDGTPIKSWQDQDAAWHHVVLELKALIEKSGQELILATDNRKLSDALESALSRERDLKERLAALERELEDLHGRLRQFAELEAASVALRRDAEAAQAREAELTVKHGQTLRDLELLRQRGETLSSQLAQARSAAAEAAAKAARRMEQPPADAGGEEDEEDEEGPSNAADSDARHVTLRALKLGALALAGAVLCFVGGWLTHWSFAGALAGASGSPAATNSSLAATNRFAESPWLDSDFCAKQIAALTAGSSVNDGADAATVERVITPYLRATFSDRDHVRLSCPPKTKGKPRVVRAPNGPKVYQVEGGDVGASILVHIVGDAKRSLMQYLTRRTNPLLLVTLGISRSGNELYTWQETPDTGSPIGDCVRLAWDPDSALGGEILHISLGVNPEKTKEGWFDFSTMCEGSLDGSVYSRARLLGSPDRPRVNELVDWIIAQGLPENDFMHKTVVTVRRHHSDAGPDWLEIEDWPREKK
jgi:hypothetical protein